MPILLLRRPINPGQSWVLQVQLICRYLGMIPFLCPPPQVGSNKLHYSHTVDDGLILTVGMEWDNIVWYRDDQQQGTGNVLTVFKFADYRVTGIQQPSNCSSYIIFTIVDKDHNSTNSSSSSDTVAKSNKTFLASVIAIPIGVTLLLGLTTFFIMQRRIQKKKKKEDQSIEMGNSTKDDWEIEYSEITLMSELGRGAFGVVYKCRWRNTDCVVKQLDKSKNDEESIRQFLKEASNVK